MQALPIALYRAAQVRELDRIAIQERGIPGYTLMSRAGATAFAALQERWPQTRRVVVVCGGGNNGGDAYAAARLCAWKTQFRIEGIEQDLQNWTTSFDLTEVV